MQGSGNSSNDSDKNNPEESASPADIEQSLAGFSVEQTISIPGKTSQSGIQSKEIVSEDGSESISFDLSASAAPQTEETFDSSATLPSGANFSSAPEDMASFGTESREDATLPSAGSFGGADESSRTLPSAENFGTTSEDQTIASGAGSFGSAQRSSYGSCSGSDQTIQSSSPEDRTIASTPGSVSASGSTSRSGASRSGASGSYSGGSSQSHAKSLDEKHDLSVGGSSSISVNIRPRNIISSVATDTISTDLNTPDSIFSMADYEIESKLGEGGMGVVYTARQSSIDRSIALKVVKGTGNVSKRQKARFLLEAIVTGDLDHPNIVPVYDLGKDPQGNIFYAMKQVQGKPWDKEIKNLSLRENLDILIDTCNAIAFAHSRKVIHRDLKPENIMLGSYGEVLVMDWGLAVSVKKGGKAEPLGTGVGIAGTPAYMAPEMAGKDWTKLGFHSDVYLLGAILYEIVTGKRPHKGRGAMECLKAAAANELVETDIDNELVKIALRALATDPAERPASAKEFADQIREYLSHEDSIKLAARAEESLQKARNSQDYNDFNATIFGYREALELWPENTKAQKGLALAVLALAEVAFKKGDFDLARSNLQIENSEHKQLLAQIEQAQQEAQQRQKMFGLLKKAAAALVVLVIVISVAGYIMVKAQRDEAKRQEAIAIQEQQRAEEEKVRAEKEKKRADIQRDKALANKELAEKNAKIAKENETIAKVEKKKAQLSEQKAVQALADLSVARTKKERAMAQAKAQKLLAEQRKEQMEKIEATRENNWWGFKPTQAAITQQQQAAKAKYPLQQTVELPGKTPLTMQFIPAGKFGMGSRTDEPGRRGEEVLHRVEITKPFYMGKYEITNAQWQAVMTGQKPQQEKNANAPVVNVSWTEVNGKFLPALNRYAPKGWKFVLPSEAQWEWACRAGSNNIYNVKAPKQKAFWFYESKVNAAQPVGQLMPNAWGLYDMHGNAAEMCRDIFNEDYYTFSPEKDPVNLQGGKYRVTRGGSWISQPESCRSATRNFVDTENKYDYCGVRVVLVPNKK